MYVYLFKTHSFVSFLVQVDGVAFKKTFSYAGFEMQKKQYDHPKIAMLNIELVSFIRPMPEP